MIDKSFDKIPWLSYAYVDTDFSRWDYAMK